MWQQWCVLFLGNALFGGVRLHCCAIVAGCTFPKAWEGSWFQREFTSDHGPIIIKDSTMQGKGKCIESAVSPGIGTEIMTGRFIIKDE